MPEYENITVVLKVPKHEDGARARLHGGFQPGTILNGCEITGVSLKDELNNTAKTHDICLNPFSDVNDLAKEMDFLTTMISRMAGRGRTMGADESLALESVIRDAFAEKFQDTGIEDVARHCRAHEDQRVRDMGTMLFPFTRSGQFGSLFNGKANVESLSPDMVSLLKYVASL